MQQKLYQKLYKTNLFQMPKQLLLITVCISPLLIIVAMTRLMFFIVFNFIFIFLNTFFVKFIMKHDYCYRLVVFLSSGVVYRFNIDESKITEKKQLKVLNHHGVFDVFLMYFFSKYKFKNLIVSYPLIYYETMKKYVFFFYQNITMTNNIKITKNALDNEITFFPEGAGKKAFVVINFNNKLFKYYNSVIPFAVKYNYIIPIFNYYGVHLPFHKTVAFLCMILSPATIITIYQMEEIEYVSEEYDKIAKKCQTLIAEKINYEIIDLTFSQKDFDKYINSKNLIGRGN